MSLERLREKETELNGLIRSLTCEPDSDAIAASNAHKRISELTSQRAADLETVTEKKAMVEGLNVKIARLLTVVNAFKKERDSLEAHVKSCDDDFERTRKSLNDLEEQIIAIQRKLAASKDPDLVTLLTLSLKSIEKRATTSRADVTRSVVVFKDAQEDYQKIEEELRKKEAEHKKLLEQSEKEKSELDILLREREMEKCSHEREIALHNSQLSTLEQKKKEKIVKIFDIEKQLLGIEYQKKMMELDAKQKSMCNMLSIDTSGVSRYSSLP